MGPERTHKSESIDASRRQVLTSVGGGLAATLSGLLGVTYRKNISPSTDSTTQRMTQHSNSTAPFSQRPQRSAYVALPGGSMTSLLANLPYIVNIATEQLPVVLVDKHDYNRIQTWGAKGAGGPGNLNVALAYGTLHRQGVIQLVDYSDFYPQYEQKSTLQQNRALIEQLSDDVQQRAAVQSADGWVDYGRGAYQDQFRASLGKEVSRFRNARRTDEKRRDKLDRGLSAPSKWNERVLNRYLAALHIRQYADDILNLDVKGIIGEGESATIGRILASADELPAANIAHIKNLDPAIHLGDLTTEMVAPTREALDFIAEIATDISGVQHQDWITIGSTLAIPQYHNLFDMETIQEQTQEGTDTDALAEEAMLAVTTLRRRTEDGPSSHKMSYMTEWIGEQMSSSYPSGQTQSWGLTEMADYAVNLSQYSSELRSLVKDSNISQAAALVGVSVVSDPSPRDDLSAIHQRSEDIINRLNPPLVDEAQLKAARRRGTAWDEHPDWYEMTNRAR